MRPNAHRRAILTPVGLLVAVLGLVGRHCGAQVAMYQYMRLCGYPAEKITILSTYNGQKHLLRDVLRQRCNHPLFGMPAAVTTVDKYQGQQVGGAVEGRAGIHHKGPPA
jgi:hypothetical protein